MLLFQLCVNRDRNARVLWYIHLISLYQCFDRKFPNKKGSGCWYWYCIRPNNWSKTSGQTAQNQCPRSRVLFFVAQELIRIKMKPCASAYTLQYNEAHHSGTGLEQHMRKHQRIIPTRRGDQEKQCSRAQTYLHSDYNEKTAHVRWKGLCLYTERERDKDSWTWGSKFFVLH